jgi:hypothetical protein
MRSPVEIGWIRKPFPELFLSRSFQVRKRRRPTVPTLASSGGSALTVAQPPSRPANSSVIDNQEFIDSANSPSLEPPLQNPPQQLENQTPQPPALADQSLRRSPTPRRSESPVGHVDEGSISRQARRKDSWFEDHKRQTDIDRRSVATQTPPRWARTESNTEQGCSTTMSFRFTPEELAVALAAVDADRAERRAQEGRRSSSRDRSKNHDEKPKKEEVSIRDLDPSTPTVLYYRSLNNDQISFRIPTSRTTAASRGSSSFAMMERSGCPNTRRICEYVRVREILDTIVVYIYILTPTDRQKNA